MKTYKRDTTNAETRPKRRSALSLACNTSEVLSTLRDGEDMNSLTYSNVQRQERGAVVRHAYLGWTSGLRNLYEPPLGIVAVISLVQLDYNPQHMSSGEDETALEFDPTFLIPVAHIELFRLRANIDYRNPSIKTYHRQIIGVINTTLLEEGVVEFISGSIKEINEEHKRSSGFDIIAKHYSYNLVQKTFESTVNKSYRINTNKGKVDLIDNPILPSEWPSRINDLVRSTVVCRYIDGLEYVSSRLSRRLETRGWKCTYEPVTIDRGYYAYHLYFEIPITYLDFRSQEEIRCNVKIEVQVTTQFQEVLYDLTHKNYENLRVAKIVRPEDWQWKFGDPLFKAAYISHALHLLEANILELRLSQEQASQEAE